MKLDREAMLPTYPEPFEHVDGGEFMDAQWLATNEKPFQAWVVARARDAGWDIIYHTYDSRKSTPGFPDLHLVKMSPPRIIYAELKKQNGKVAPSQKSCLDVLATVADSLEGVEVYLWRPADRETILEILEGESHDHA